MRAKRQEGEKEARNKELKKKSRIGSSKALFSHFEATVSVVPLAGA